MKDHQRQCGVKEPMAKYLHRMREKTCKSAMRLRRAAPVSNLNMRNAREIVPFGLQSRVLLQLGELLLLPLSATPRENDS